MSHLTDDECGTIVAASLSALRVLGGRDADVLLTTVEGIVARHVAEVEQKREEWEESSANWQQAHDNEHDRRKAAEAALAKAEREARQRKIMQNEQARVIATLRASYREAGDPEPEHQRRLAQQYEQALVEIEHLKRSVERHGPCICDTGPGTEGPEEFCPQHGRTYDEMLAMLTDDYGKVSDALSRVRKVLDEEAFYIPTQYEQDALVYADHVRKALEQVSPTPIKE